MQGSGLQMKMFDATSGKSVAVPDQARFFYVKEPNMMVHIDDSTNELKFHIGEDIDIDNESVNNMMTQLKSMARTNMLDFDIRSFGKHIEPKNYTYKIEQNKEQTMTDHVNEGMGPLSGSSRTSRQTLENVRLILKHRAPVNEESRGSRSRNISAIFVETGEGERFKYPFIHLNGARAMARHIASGGETHDIVGEAIVELSDNLSRLKEFMGVVNKQQLVNETNRADVWNVKRSMNSIKETVQRIQGARGYANFVEGIALKEEKPQLEISEEAVDTFVQKFTKSTFEESLRDIFPLLHKVNEEEMENRRVNQVDRIKEIMTATVKKTGEKINNISFGDSRDPEYDYDQIKNQYIEPRSPEEAAQKKIDMIAMTFDALSDRVVVDTLEDKNKKKKGHDLAAELSFFLTDIANDIRTNPRGVDKEELRVASQLLKMSKEKIETIEPKTADTQISEMLEEAFSKFDPDRVLMKEEKEIYWDYEDIGGNLIVNPKSTIEDQIAELLSREPYNISAMEFDPSKIEIHEDDGLIKRQDGKYDGEDDYMLKKDPATGKYDPEEVKQMQKDGAEMARQKANQKMRDKLNKEIDTSEKATTITVEYDLELDTPKSKNPLLKRHYQLMKKFNVFISMPEWQEGPPDSGFGQWFANVRGSKENLKGWLKAWDYDYDERDYEDMGLGESATIDEDDSEASENTNQENNMNKDRLGDLAGIKRETQINEDESVFDEFVKMYKELDHEGTDEIVFGLSNHPKYRFSMANELNLDKETNRFNSYHGMTDHSGYVDIKISDLKAHMNGVAVHDNTKPTKMAGDWKTEDDVLPPEPRDPQYYDHADDYEDSDTPEKYSYRGPDGEFASGPDDDQIRIRHLAGIDDF